LDLTDYAQMADHAIDKTGSPFGDATLAALMHQSPIFFAQVLLRGPPEAPFYGKYLVGPHHHEWDRIVTENPRFAVMSSRNSGKTFFYSFALPIWRAACNPGQSGVIFSATADLSERMLSDIKQEVETNPRLQFLLPNRQINKWSSRQIHLANGHKIYARGWRSRVRGMHPHWIICDDVLGDEDGWSDTQRRKNKDYFFTAVSSMVVRGGQIGVVGTPFHSQDLLCDFANNPVYCFWRYPALLPDGESMWPELYSKELLEEQKLEIGTVRFEREKMCRPVSDEMSLFPKKLFFNEQMRPELTLGMPKEHYTANGIEIFMAVDFAFSSSVSADYFVIWLMGKDAQGNRYIVDIYRDKGIPYQEQLALITTYGIRYEPVIMHLEANQAQRIVADELIRTTSLPIVKYTTGTEKNTLDKGVPSLRILLENQKFRIPRGDERSIELTDLWINEMHNFTWVNGKLAQVGGHDDMCMALYLTEQAIRRGGFSVDFGDGEEEFAQPRLGGVPVNHGVPYNPQAPLAQAPLAQPQEELGMPLVDVMARYHGS
jgi:hypothetical protein